MGCGGAPLAAEGRCWTHYRGLRKEVPSDRRKGLGPYRGMPRKLILELANLKRAERLLGRQRHIEVRELLFGKIKE
jgi:hypothetical protein